MNNQGYGSAMISSRVPAELLDISLASETEYIQIISHKKEVSEHNPKISVLSLYPYREEVSEHNSETSGFSAPTKT
jgi:hypothetical protein